jgi:hypothetical protein
VKSFDGTQKEPSENISKSSLKVYSIAVSKLLEVKTILSKFTFISIFSSIGVVVIDAVA